MTQFGDNLVEALTPWASDDTMVLSQAFGSMWAQVELYAADDPEGDGNDGWSILLDVDRSPYPDGLNYLAQWVGERLPVGIAEGDARQWIRDQPNSIRGTPEGIAKAAARSLTAPAGERIVQILERTMPDGSPDPNGDNFIIYTMLDQTPNPAQVFQDLMTATPADMHCEYNTLASATYAELEAGSPTYAAIEAAYPTYGALYSATPTVDVWLV